jgi:hypothetical protein
MGDNGKPLEQLIDRQRQELGDNIEALAGKARAVTDWKGRVDAHPMQMLGIAAGGGALIGLMAGRRRARRPAGEAAPAAGSQAPRKRSAGGALARDIRVAMGGVAAAAAIEFLSEAIPGFGDHFRRGSE